MAVGLVVAFHLMVAFHFVVTVEATEWKCSVGFIFGLHLIGVMANLRNDFMNFSLRYFIRIVNYIKLFRLGAPLGFFNPLMIKGGLDPLFAHGAIAIHFNGRSYDF